MMELKPIEEYLKSQTFLSKLGERLRNINKMRANVLKVRKDVKFKRGPIDYLEKIGRFNATGIANLIPDILEKKSELPSSVRRFIQDIALRPLQEAIDEDIKRQSEEEKKMTAYTAPGIKDVDEIIAEVFGISLEKMRSCGRRFREETEARQFSIWFHLYYCQLKPKVIAGFYSKNRSTVYWSVKVVNDLLETNKEFRRKAETAIQRLKTAGYGI